MSEQRINHRIECFEQLSARFIDLLESSIADLSRVESIGPSLLAEEVSRNPFSAELHNEQMMSLRDAFQTAFDSALATLETAKWFGGDIAVNEGNRPLEPKAEIEPEPVMSMRLQRLKTSFDELWAVEMVEMKEEAGHHISDLPDLHMSQQLIKMWGLEASRREDEKREP